jgi:ribonuclease HII
MSTTKYIVTAGCDEVGRGCLAGPVIAAAVILPRDYDDISLKDSKQLTQKQRGILDAVIREEAIDWAIGLATPDEIDAINILNASHLAMHRAIDRLTVRPELLLVDGKYFKAYVDIPHKCIIRGDQLVSSIAAASIIAKVYRDNYMQELSIQEPGYDWDNNMGYPTRKHRMAIQDIGITPHHRKSFHHVAECLQPVLM